MSAPVGWWVVGVVGNVGFRDYSNAAVRPRLTTRVRTVYVFARTPHTQQNMSFADLRGALLDAAPDANGEDDGDSEEEDTSADSQLLEWTRQVNAAEATFWTAASGERVADSTEILGFECGGSQWVLETVRRSSLPGWRGFCFVWLCVCGCREYVDCCGVCG